MRSRQLAGKVRTALLIAACAALVAMTSGLLLTLHLLTAEHSATHHSHDCSVCQQLLASSKKVLPAPDVDLVQQSPAVRFDAPARVEHVEHRYAEVSRPRGPPCFSLHQSA
ncbi:MAG: hypothetical protein ABFE01_26060 [Phycisphaerales bacterium]